MISHCPLAATVAWPWGGFTPETPETRLEEDVAVALLRCQSCSPDSSARRWFHSVRFPRFRRTPAEARAEKRNRCS
ncbi:hypothetical protein GN956_G13871 [Arapaima gigas]